MDEEIVSQNPVPAEPLVAPTPPPIPEESFWSRWKGIILLIAAMCAIGLFGLLIYRTTVYVGKIQRGEVIDVSAFSNNTSASQLSDTGIQKIETVNNEAVNNFADDPSIGPENAAVTLVMFEDFECPYCEQLFPVIVAARKQYANDIRFVYRDFPLTDIHPNAQKAAEAGNCANAQGAFWTYHDLLFRNQDKLTVPDLKKYAQTTGLDTEKFNTCLDSGEYADEVQQDFEDGVRAGVSGTPTLFFNGNPVKGAITQSGFDQVMSLLLQSTNQSTNQ